MRILIEALGIHYTGGGRSATLNLLEPLFNLGDGIEYAVLLSQPEPALDTDTANVRQIIAPTQDRFGLRLWAQFVVPRLARDYDLVHFVKNLSVFGVSSKTVVTVYDLTVLLYPHLFPRTDVWYWRWVQPRMLRNADRVISISKTTARDLQEFYDLPSESITPIYPSYNARFRPVQREEKQRVMRKYRLPDEIIMHVGRLDRKKNLPNLLHAFSGFKEHSDFEGKLVLVGEEYPKSLDTTLDRTAEQLQIADDVIFTGPVPVEDLPGLYGSATMVVFPSLHEGFGLVAVEAMACGTPLVVTDAGAVREVVGEAALIVDSPCDVTGLRESMLRLWQDPSLRQDLRTKGLHAVKRFSQERAVRQTLRLYREVIGTK